MLPLCRGPLRGRSPGAGARGARAGGGSETVKLPDPLSTVDGIEIASPPAAHVDAELRLMELRHRSKNMLAIVTALVNQTLQGSLTLDEAREVLTARLVAMGNALDLLVEEDGEVASLPELTERALSHFGGRSERISIAGPEIAVGPTTALHLALAFHELETNAIKYGALSGRTGRVSLCWEISTDAEPIVKIYWQERDGPRVAAPTRNGFGSRLTSSLLARRVRGQAKQCFAEEGFSWTLLAPLSAMLQ